MYFLAKETEYVGFIINKNGTYLNPHKINAINELSEPKDLKQLQSFLGDSIIIQSLFQIWQKLQKDSNV